MARNNETNYRDLVHIVENLAEADTHAQQSFANAKTALQLRHYDNMNREFDRYFCRTITEVAHSWKKLTDAHKILEKGRDFVSYDVPYRPDDFVEAFLTRNAGIKGALSKRIMGDFHFNLTDSPRDLDLIDKEHHKNVAVMTWESDRPHVFLCVYNDGDERIKKVQDMIRDQAMREGIQIMEEPREPSQ